MSFIAETQILTSSGWKEIKDVSGRDRVLVRNFLGEAEFIKPFALHRKQYDGPVRELGSKRWAITVTPDHVLSYYKSDRLKKVSAEDFIPNRVHKFYRKFRYLPEDKRGEKITIKEGDYLRQVRMSAEHWYIIMAYTLIRGYINKEKNPHLKFMLKTEEQVSIITEILNHYGVSWGRTSNHYGSPVITVNKSSNLARKLKRGLGARARRDMRIPTQIIYGSNRYLTRIFVETIKSLAGVPDPNGLGRHVLRTSNPSMSADLFTMGLLGGYDIRTWASAGYGGEAHVVSISGGEDTYSPIYNVESRYHGSVYAIDIFEGQILLRNGYVTIWMSPK